MPFTPYDAARHMIKRADALLDLATRLRRAQVVEVASPHGGRPVRDDLRRLAIVMAVGALDTYMHRLIVVRAYEHEVMPSKLADLTVRFGDLIDLAESTVQARKDGRDIRPKVPAKRLLRERLSRETFQRYDRVSEALAMAGKPKSWDSIAAAMPGSPAKESLKLRLNDLVDSRNAIVHEGHYERLDRPQTPKVIELTVEDARESVRFLSDLVDAIHTVIR